MRFGSRVPYRERMSVEELAKANAAFIADVLRRTEKWERRPERISAVVWLYEVLGWLAGEIEARR